MLLVGATRQMAPGRQGMAGNMHVTWFLRLPNGSYHLVAYCGELRRVHVRPARIPESLWLVGDVTSRSPGGAKLVRCNGFRYLSAVYSWTNQLDSSRGLTLSRVRVLFCGSRTISNGNLARDFWDKEKIGERLGPDP